MEQLRILLDISQRSDWDIATALRGPDASGEASTILKLLSTAVVRHLWGGNRLQSHGSVMSPRKAKHYWANCDPDLKDKVRRLWRRRYHFQKHVLRAFIALAAKKRRGAISYRKWLIEELTSRKDMRRPLIV